MAAAHIVDGRVPHALLLEVFTDAGIGTMVAAKREELQGQLDLVVPKPRWSEATTGIALLCWSPLRKNTPTPHRRVGVSG